jgi:tetratricopeptide (TPR) repeat protein
MELKLANAYCVLGGIQRDGLYKANNEAEKHEDTKENLKDAAKNFEKAKEILTKRLEKTLSSENDKRNELSRKLAAVYCNMGKTYEKQSLTSEQVIAQYRFALEKWAECNDALQALSELAIRQKNEEDQKDEADNDYSAVIRTFRTILNILSTYADDSNYAYNLRRGLLACYCKVKEKNEGQYEVAQGVYKKMKEYHLDWLKTDSDYQQLQPDLIKWENQVFQNRPLITRWTTERVFYSDAEADLDHDW